MTTKHNEPSSSVLRFRGAKLPKTLHVADALQCRLMLELGAQVDERDCDGQTAMHCAADVGDIEKIRLLGFANANPNIAAEAICNHMTPMHIAAYGADAAVIQALLDVGADRMALNDEGQTPYDIACGFAPSNTAALSLLKPTCDDQKRRAEWCARELDASMKKPQPSRRVFDVAPALALAEELGATPDARALVPLMQRAMRKRGTLAGGFRQLSLSPSRESLAALRTNFPNFGAVIDLIERRGALAAMADGAFALPPILLVGPPGVGKTHFAKQLATLASTPFHEIPMATASTGWMLSGLDRSWSGGKPGSIFRSLCVHDDAVANPLFLLDEIDKVSGGKGNASRADAALYALLEPTSAARFEDECVPIPLDASAILVLATANDLDSIPAPLLSRFEVFHIEPAAPSERRAIARSVHAHVCASNPWGSHFTDALEEDVMDVLIHEHEDARSLRKAITDACAMAAMRGEKKVRVSDIPRARTAKRRTVGFV